MIPSETGNLNTEIYAIPALGNWLLFSPKAWMSAVVNRAAVSAIARGLNPKRMPLSGDTGELFQALTCGQLSTAAQEQRFAKLVIIPTRACNMRCIYCDFSATGSSQTALDPMVACRAVDCHLERAKKRNQNEMGIHFFGGEPLIARECVETVVHYARFICARNGMVPWFELTTNGFFSSGMESFLGDYFDSIVISLDGTQELHDYSRRQINSGGTYKEIAANIRRLSKYSTELCLRMCVTDRSADMMEGVANVFCHEFEFDALSFEMLVENEHGEHSDLHSPDPYAFAAGVLEAESLALKRGVRVVHGPSELVGPRISSCPLGKGTLMVTPEGQLTACYLSPEDWKSRGLDLVIGNVDAVSGAFIDESALKRMEELVQLKPRCSRCFCKSTCAGGCHIKHTPPGCSLDYDDRCRAIRLITAGRLLRRLGCDNDVKLLLDSRSAMEVLACHPDDRVDRWAEGS